MKNINLYLRSGVMVMLLFMACFSLQAQSDKFKTSERVVALDGGTVQLKNGIATVHFSEAIAHKLANAKANYLVSLTPIGDCGALKVLKKSGDGFTVQEIAQPTSNATFDYLVFVKRTIATGLLNENQPK